MSEDELEQRFDPTCSFNKTHKMGSDRGLGARELLEDRKGEQHLYAAGFFFPKVVYLI